MSTLDPDFIGPPQNPRGPTPTFTVPSDDDQGDVITHPSFYYIGLAALGGFYAVVGLILAFFGPTIPLGGETYNSGYVLWIVGVTHFAVGFTIVDANRIGGVFVLGRMTIEASGTFLIVPPGLMWFISLPILTQEMEIPAEPQNIWRGEGPPPAERPELRPPIRITFAEGGDKDDPLQRRVTQEVSFFVRLRVDKFFNFYTRIGTIEDAKHQMEDVGVSYLADVLPQYTLSEAIKKVTKFSEELERQLEEATLGWGAKILMARVKQFPFSKSLNEAIQRMAESSATKIATITESEGDRERRANEGVGDGRAAHARLKGRGDGLKEMAQTLGVDGKDILAAETARDIGQSPSTKIIVGADGLRQLVGAGAAVAETFTGRATPAQNPPQTPQGNP